MRRRALLIAAATLLAAPVLLGGCARQDPETRAARKVSERYLRALVRQDLQEVKRLSTVVVSMSSIAGGRVLSVGPAERTRLRTLDSLLAAVDAERRTADSLWSLASDETADSLFQAVRLLNRRQVIVRCAQRGAQASLPESVLTSDAPVELRRVLTRMRYAGPRVGPRPVDRELVLRMIRAGSGDWVVYSFFLTADDVWPWPPPRAR